MAVLFQRPVLLVFANAADQPMLVGLSKGAWEVLFDGYRASTGAEQLYARLSHGGMSSMLQVLWLVIAPMSFGAAMEHAGVLHRLLIGIVSPAHTTGALISATVATCVAVNTLAADQHMSIVITGRIFMNEFQRRRCSSRIFRESSRTQAHCRHC